MGVKAPKTIKKELRINILYEDKYIIRGELIMNLPVNFLWGGATSANQTEGSFDTDGRGITNFDMLPMNPTRLQDVVIDEENFLNQSFDYYSGRKGIDFYNRFKEDIEL